jgi:hypothetical protein
MLTGTHVSIMQVSNQVPIGVFLFTRQNTNSNEVITMWAKRIFAARVFLVLFMVYWINIQC